MTSIRRFPFLLAALALIALAGCAPTNANTTYGAGEVGTSAPVVYGTIVSMQPVTVKPANNGAGALAGAVAGGVGGSFIGGDTRSNVLAGLGGAALGGLAGNYIQNQVGTGTAVEFVIREDNGQLISVVQTNEANFHVGQRVAIIQGEQTRLAPAQ